MAKKPILCVARDIESWRFGRRRQARGQMPGTLLRKYYSSRAPAHAL